MAASPNADIAGLKARAAALRQSARLPRAQSQLLLDAALAELDAAVAALDAGGGTADSAADGRTRNGMQTDRRLLHAIFTTAPTPLYVVDQNGTVLRGNSAASELLGAGPGYVTGKSLATLVEPAARAALRSQLAATLRTSTESRLRCGMLATSGVVPCELAIQPLTVRGDPDRLLVSLTAGRSRTSRTAHDRRAGNAQTDRTAADADSVRRLDLLARAARLLLESTSVSESVLLQRSARLMTSSLATWAIIDLHRRGQLRRHYVAGPDDPESAALAQLAAATEAVPGTVPDQVAGSGQMLLVSHVADEGALGPTPDGQPLLAVLDAASVLAVPMTDGSTCHGVLTLIRRASDGQFAMADAALAEEIGALLGRAVSARRVLHERTETAEALRASLLPPVLKSVPGVEIASAHLAPTRGREVGGDFYDVYPTPGGRGFAIGDVCGKGEDAAAATAAARHAIRVLAHSEADPAHVLRSANEIMLAEEFGGRFVTASAAHVSWDDDKLRVVLASAGHPGPVLVRSDGRTQLLPGGGVPLGIFADPEPATTRLQLSPGDILFFYTDGLTDARSQQSAYLEDSLTDCLAQLAGRRVADVVSDMRKVVLDFCANVLLDDLTMVAMRVGNPPSR